MTTQTNMISEMVDVKVTPCESQPNYSWVHTIWSNVDRPDVGGWQVANRNVARLLRALHAGVVFGPVTIRTDVNGKTYPSKDQKVFAKTMNADLRRLGF